MSSGLPFNNPLERTELRSVAQLYRSAHIVVHSGSQSGPLRHLIKCSVESIGRVVLMPRFSSALSQSWVSNVESEHIAHLVQELRGQCLTFHFGLLFFGDDYGFAPIIDPRLSDLD